MIDARRLAIPDVIHIRQRKFVDARGHFSETYNERAFAEIGVAVRFVQDNQSLSKNAGTIRGTHFQSPPFAQDKLVRVVKGRVLDVCVDIRRTSPTFGQHVAMELSSEEGDQLFVPIGFAHGFCTLEPDTEVLYKVSNFYSPQHDLGILWNDPELNVAWPVVAAQAVVSDKDRALPLLKDLVTPF